MLYIIANLFEEPAHGICCSELIKSSNNSGVLVWAKYHI